MNAYVPSVFIALAMLLCIIFLIREKPLGLIVFAILFIILGLLTEPWK